MIGCRISLLIKRVCPDHSGAIGNASVPAQTGTSKHATSESTKSTEAKLSKNAEAGPSGDEKDSGTQEEDVDVFDDPMFGTSPPSVPYGIGELADQCS